VRPRPFAIAFYPAFSLDLRPRPPPPPPFPLHDALPICVSTEPYWKLSRLAASGSEPPDDCSRFRTATRVTPTPRRLQSSGGSDRSEEHTSELQSRGHLVCRLMLEKKNIAPRPHSQPLLP